jgi:hypothetical protein
MIFGREYIQTGQANYFNFKVERSGLISFSGKGDIFYLAHYQSKRLRVGDHELSRL